MSDQEPTSDNFIELVEDSVDESEVCDDDFLDEADHLPGPEGGVSFTMVRLLAIVTLVVLFDLFIYRGHGNSGAAAFFVAGLICLVVASPRRVINLPTVIVTLLMLAVGAKLVWEGNSFLLFSGVVLMGAFSLSLNGRTPFVLDVFVNLLHAPFAGFPAFLSMRAGLRNLSRGRPDRFALKFLLPLLIATLFGGVFVLANPDVAKDVRAWIESITSEFFPWLTDVLPHVDETILWSIVALSAAGSLQPLTRESLLHWMEANRTDQADEKSLFAGELHFAAIRNTLISLIVLFAVYLVFEFRTLWFREFPDGFYYAGYAHHGAAWLTFALALASGLLSIAFRDRIQNHPQVGTLRRLVWAWSLLNIVLTISVYNRLWIYVGFNGMTRMRTVGIFGVTAVLIGFLVVLRKITARHDFAWLVRRHVWTLSLTVLCLALAPVDYLVHSYNTRRILAGDPAPSVQIMWHEINSSGLLAILPLQDAPQPEIRNGIRGFLALHAERIRDERLRSSHWTAFQWADHMLRDELTKPINIDDIEHKLPSAVDDFKEYTYQWY